MLQAFVVKEAFGLGLAVYDMQFMRANISLAQRELGYKPMADLQMGLKKFFGFCSGEKMAAR